jgi:putative serine protease PepD
VTSPKHLWAGDWRSESDRARNGADAQEPLPTVEPIELPERPRAAGDEPVTERLEPAPEPAVRVPRRWIAPVAIAAAAVTVGAFAIGSLTGGGDDNNSSSPSATALPAVSGAAPKVKNAHTRAGAIYAYASPAVVSVRTNSGSGTAFLIDGNGTLVTNAHVVGGSHQVLVRFGQNTASINAQVQGADASSDLAVIKIDPGQVPKGVKPLQFADSGAVQVGDSVIAIGNPFDLDRTATEGIVSGLGRHIQAPNGFEIDAAIQTDAPINPGNSGGPLLDTNARVIGVNSQIQTAGSGGNVGVGFAVPSNTVRAVVPVLERGETVKRAYLGVQTSPASPTNPDGAKIESVVPGAPADKGGLKQGDVITKIDGKSVQDPNGISAAVAAKRPGDKVTITVERGLVTEEVTVTLGTRPAHTP